MAGEDLSAETKRAIGKLEAICGRDVGRGIAPLVRAARGGLGAAAASIVAHPAPHLAILTGFFIPHATPPAAETDGPVGAAHLAAALTRVGVPVRLVTDPPCAGAVAAAAGAAGCGPDLAFHVVGVDAGDEEIAALRRAWQSVHPPVSHVIALERVGPSYDGPCRNLRGDDVSAHTAPLEKVFIGPWTTIAVGDGGNELGMGSLPRRLIAAHVDHGERIACAVPCDHLVVCGVSNWGGPALLAALALVRPEWRRGLTAGLTAAADRKILAATVREGPAVDGITGRRELSVDGLPWARHARVLERILDVLGPGH